MKIFIYTALLSFLFVFVADSQAYNQNFSYKLIDDYFNGKYFDKKYFVDSAPKALSKKSFEIKIDDIFQSPTKDEINKDIEYTYNFLREITVKECFGQEECDGEKVIVYKYSQHLNTEGISSVEFHDLSLLGLQKNIDKNSNSKNDFINKIISKYDPQGLTNHEYYDNIEYGILYVQINRKVNLEIHYNTMSNKINKIRFATSR